MDVATELEVLGLVSDRLEAHKLPFMLTGSFALAYYSTPRMTRDLDIVLALAEKDVEQLAVSREDLILSKLAWAFESGSELQRRDIRQLLAGPVELDYIRLWARRLDVIDLLDELMP